MYGLRRCSVYECVQYKDVCNVKRCLMYVRMCSMKGFVQCKEVFNVRMCSI